MKNILNRTTLLILMLVTGYMIFSSCDNYETPVLGKPKAGGVYLHQARQGLIQVDLSNINKEDTLEYNANIGGVGSADKDIIVHFKADPSLVSTYNSENSTSYTVLPQGNYELTRTKDTISAGVKYGEKIGLIIKNYPNKLDVKKEYLLPISLEQVNGGLSINKNLQNAYFVVSNSFFNRPAGNGTITDPYKVAILENLQWINENPSSWDAHFIQTEDIDATDTKNWNGGEGLIPIGKDKPYFEGTFDGQGHTIKGVYINRPKTAWVGFFKRVAPSGVVKDLELKDVDITGLDDVGGLVGLFYGRIDGVKVSSGQVNGTVQGSSSNDNIGGIVGSSHGNLYNSGCGADVIGKGDHVGGLVGYIADGTEIKDSYATGNVTGDGKEVGGLVGDNHASITNCYATGDVHGTGGDYTGGLLGINYSPVSNSYATGKVIGDGATNGGLVGNSHGSITDCYATGNVISNGGGSTGGLAGYLIDGSVDNSYATGDVQNNGDGLTGGLVGYDKTNADIIGSFSTGNVQTVSNYVGGLTGDSHSNITNSYATGNASTGNNKYAGGLVGQYAPGASGGITNCYSTGKASNSNNTAAGLVGNLSSGTVKQSYWDTQSSGLSSSAGGTGLSTSAMQGSNAKTNMSGFDFSGVWQTKSGDYPILQKNHL